MGSILERKIELGLGTAERRTKIPFVFFDFCFVTNLSHFTWPVGGFGALNSNCNPLQTGLPLKLLSWHSVIGLLLTLEENKP